MRKSNSLSRRPDWEIGVEKDEVIKVVKEMKQVGVKMLRDEE